MPERVEVIHASILLNDIIKMTEAQPIATPPSILSLRLRINKEIVLLSSSSSSSAAAAATSDKALIATRLSPLFDETMSAVEEVEDNGDNHTPQNTADEDDGITPLMVACDRGSTACLEWMLLEMERRATKEKATTNNNTTTHLESLVKVLGLPLDYSRKDRNTALHHAAMSGCFAAIDILARMLFLTRTDNVVDTAAMDEKWNAEQPSLVLLLGTAVNAHGDTPLMMAAAAAAAAATTTTTTTAEKTMPPLDPSSGIDIESSLPTPGNFVRAWVRTMLQNNKNSNLVGLQSAVRTALEATNEAGDSCTTLACTNCHNDLVQYLLGVENTDRRSDNLALPIRLQTEEVFHCRESVQSMARTFEGIPTNVRQKFQRKMDGMKSCLELLESTLVRQSEQAAHELLNEWDGSGKSSGDFSGAIANTNGARSAKKKKKKAKSKDKQIMEVGVKKKGSEGIWGDREKGTSATERSCTNLGNLLTRLDDGKVAVRAPGQVLRETEHALKLHPTRASASAVMLLRERVKGMTTNDDVDAFMSALCITPKSLLLSQHGMALDLSPAQLDAVQAILEQQLGNAHKARGIQERRTRNNTMGTQNDYA